MPRTKPSAEPSRENEKQFRRNPGETMRTLLRHQPSGQYFQALNRWTQSPQKAHDFRCIERAFRFVTKAGFSDMEVILTFEEREAEGSRCEPLAWHLSRAAL